MNHDFNKIDRINNATLTRHCGFNPQSLAYNALNKGIAGQARNDEWGVGIASDFGYTAGAGLQPVPYQRNARITNPREQTSATLSPRNDGNNNKLVNK